MSRVAGARPGEGERRMRQSTRRRRRRSLLALGLVVAVGALTGAARPRDGFDRRSGRLESALIEAVSAQHFDQVVDFGPVEGACPGSSWCPPKAPTIAHTPNIDLAVIALDRRGRPRAAADLLVSRDYPDGIGVSIGDDLGTDDVRWRRWNPDRWNGGTFSDKDGSRTTTVGWKDNPPLTAADDIVPGREKAPIEFMAPYPASTFKLLVAFHTLRLVDRGTIDLDRDYRYDPPGGPAITRTTRELLDKMITESDNDSAKALIKQLHDLGEIDHLNAGLRDLDLGTRIRVPWTRSQNVSGFECALNASMAVPRSPSTAARNSSQSNGEVTLRFDQCDRTARCGPTSSRPTPGACSSGCWPTRAGTTSSPRRTGAGGRTRRRGSRASWPSGGSTPAPAR